MGLFSVLLINMTVQCGGNGVRLQTEEVFSAEWIIQTPSLDPLNYSFMRIRSNRSHQGDISDSCFRIYVQNMLMPLRLFPESICSVDAALACVYTNTASQHSSLFTEAKRHHRALPVRRLLG